MDLCALELEPIRFVLAMVQADPAPVPEADLVLDDRASSCAHRFVQ
jgi:hypothetical protein